MPKEDASVLAEFSVALFSDPPALLWVLPELFRSGLSIACIVSVLPRLPGVDLAEGVKREAEQRGIPFFRPGSLSSPEFQSKFFKTNPLALATMTLAKKIPNSILEGVPLGGVNYHPSYLPRYRGACPYFWPIFNGEKETGISIHQMIEEYDAGDIYVRKKVAVDPEETSGSLSMKCVKVGIPLLLLALKELKHGRKLPRIPQDPSQATQAPLPTIDLLEINWNSPAQKISALVRAASPFYGAFTSLGDQRILVWSLQISGQASDHLPPGTLVLSGGKTEVATSDVLVSLETIQHGLVRFYSGQEFLRVPGIKEGLILGNSRKGNP